MEAVGRPSTEKIVVFSVLGAGVFVVGLLLLINSVTESSREKALATVNADVQRMRDRGPSMLDQAAAVASPFVAHVGAGRFAEAYALLAAPYRNAVPAGGVREGVPRIADSRRRALGDVEPVAAAERRDRRDHRGERRARFGRGRRADRLRVAAGSGRGLRILVVSLASVPVLQGVAPR